MWATGVVGVALVVASFGGDGCLFSLSQSFLHLNLGFFFCLSSPSFESEAGVSSAKTTGVFFLNDIVRSILKASSSSSSSSSSLLSNSSRRQRFLLPRLYSLSDPLRLDCFVLIVVVVNKQLTN